MARRKSSGSDSKSTLYCSFCGKSQHEVRKLVAGPVVFICDECIDICVGMMVDDVGWEAAFPDTLASKELADLLSSVLSKLDTEPLFSVKGLSVTADSSFYLGPFQSPFNEIYSDHIRPSVQQSGFTISRADEIFGSRPIMQDIWSSIFSSQFIIADLTGKNPNVMYEVGLAHTMGKPVVMLTQDIDDVPFDLRYFRCVVYTYTPRGCAELSDKLRGTIEALGKVNYRLSY